MLPSIFSFPASVKAYIMRHARNKSAWPLVAWRRLRRDALFLSQQLIFGIGRAEELISKIGYYFTVYLYFSLPLFIIGHHHCFVVSRARKAFINSHVIPCFIPSSMRLYLLIFHDAMIVVDDDGFDTCNFTLQFLVVHTACKLAFYAEPGLMPRQAEDASIKVIS